MNLLAIDPGAKGVGYAVFEDEQLFQCGLWRVAISDLSDRCLHFGEHARTMGKIDYLVAEIPQVYRGRFQKGDPNDLIQLAAIVGAIVVAVQPKDADFFRPSEWKGQVPKDIHNARVLDNLEPEEKLVLYSCEAPKHLQHNVIDAIGLGLFALDRK